VNAPRVLAPVDVAKLGAAIAETAQRAKENDPRALKAELAATRKRIAELEAAAPELHFQDVPVFGLEVEAEMRRLRETLDKAADVVKAGMAAGVAAIAEAKRTGQAAALPTDRPAAASRAAKPAPSTAVAVARSRDVDENFGTGKRKILTVLAQYPGGRTKRQVALLAGYAINGGAFNNYLSVLRSRGLIQGAETINITVTGKVALGDFDPLPVGADLREHWMRQLGKAECAILKVLSGVHPHTLTKEGIAERAGYESSGGGFNNALSRLRTLELVEGRAMMRMSEELV
jgi:hypothetical protein